MSKEDLPVYLNDHLAGSVLALELLDHLIATYKGKPLEEFFNMLRQDISADQDALKGLIAKIGVKESPVRKAGAWVTEKVARAKIRVSSSEEGKMGLFHALETLIIGITGKRALWTALAAASSTVPELGGLDYTKFEERALEQFDRVQAKRLEVAHHVFI